MSGVGLSLSAGDDAASESQEYNPTPIINEIRSCVAAWRTLPSQND